MTVTYLVSDLIEDTKRQLSGSSRAEQNKLAADITNTATDITFSYDLMGIQRGSEIEIDDEVIYVWSVDTASKRITACERGQRGTAKASHTSGTIAVVNPRFPTYSIRYALREEIRSWGPQLFRVGNKTVQSSSGTRGYDLAGLPQGWYQIFDVQRQSTTESGEQDPHSWPRVRFKVIRNADLTDFPSGNGIVLSQSAWTNISAYPKLNVVYSYQFDVDTAFDNSTDVISQVGLDTSMIDIAPMGAAWRLLSTRDIRRTMTESQGMPTDLRDVPVGSTSSVAAQLKKIRDARISEEAQQLRSRFPYTTGF